MHDNRPSAGTGMQTTFSTPQDGGKSYLGTGSPSDTTERLKSYHQHLELPLGASVALSKLIDQTKINKALEGLRPETSDFLLTVSLQTVQ